MTRVEWTHTAETSRLLRALALVAFGAIGGFFGLVTVLALFVLAGSLLAGEFAVLAILLAFGLLGARRLATHVALARSESARGNSVLSARAVVAASVAWAAGFVALLALGASSDALFAVLVAVVFVTLPVAAALRSEGHVDTDDGVLHANNSEATLAAVDHVDRYDLGPVAVLWIHYHDGVGSSAPRLLGVPAGDVDRIRTAIESSDSDPPESDRNPTIRRTLYGFALGSFALAAAFVYFALGESGDAVGIGVYVAAFSAFFGALFAWLGYVEG